MNDNQKVLQSNVVKEYIDVMVDGLKHSFPLLYEQELRQAITWSILKRYHNGPATLNNNYSHQRFDGTVLDIINYIEKLEPIITSSGVLFKKHKEADNPLSRMIMGFIRKRKEYKKEMFKYPKGSEQFARYNLAQLLEKLNANATYGVLGAPTSMIYNLYVAEAVTRQGRSYISCSIMLFESLLSNNVKFNSLNEVITFINNVEHERPNRNCIDSAMLDRNITLEECFFKVMNTVDMTIWYPTEKEMSLVWDYLQGLGQEDLNRIYYKNNLYTFCDLPLISGLIIKILSLLEIPFMNPNDPPENIRADLDTLVLLIKEYVYYPHFYIDKLDRIEYMQRDIVCVSDTDSTIISFDAWYRYVLDKVYNIDMPIKHKKFDAIDVINEVDNPSYESEETELDYDFYTDEIIEVKKIVDPSKVVPQETLKYAIINIMAYVCSDLIVDYLNEYSKLSGSYVEGVKCRMVMKNEFYFSRALLTNNRRNYADIQTIQEGNIIPEGERMAIMGLPINKTTLSDSVKKNMQQILYEEILTADHVDQIRVIKKLAILEKQIYNSIMNKETDYYKPDNIAAINTYANPLSVNGIIAAIVYNEMRDEGAQPINLEERNKIIKIKLNVSKKNAYKIKEAYPEKYEKLIKLLDHPTIGSKVNTLALPVDVPVPDWALAFVDTQAIISDSLKNFPLDSIGVHRLDNDSVNYTNIIQL